MTFRLLLGLFVASWFTLARAGDAPAQKPPRPEVLVVADAGGTPQELRPAPGKPIHYLVIGGVERNIGDDVAEVRRPDEVMVRRELAKALASQGFIEAKEGGPKPQIAILFSWGSANYHANDEIMFLAGAGGFGDKNKAEIVQLLGMDKANRHVISQFDADQLNDAIRNDRVYMVIAAWDLEAAARKQRRLLWRTRISLDWRDDSPETFTVMLASAAPFFGRDTEKGVFVDDFLRRKAEVTIGTPRVVAHVSRNSPTGPFPPFPSHARGRRVVPGGRVPGGGHGGGRPN
jgi:hypothetical protein